MSVRNILKIGNKTLRKKSKEVTEFDEDLGNLLDDMKKTMLERNGVGISAVQVGVLRRAIVIDLDDDKFLEIINPVILKTRGSRIENEGCLSVPNFYCEVKRPKYVKIKAQDRHGKEYTFEAEEMIARCVCHEIDHLDGILFVDHTAEGQQYRDGIEKRGD